jgi:hypothetical protein
MASLNAQIAPFLLKASSRVDDHRQTPAGSGIRSGSAFIPAGAGKSSGGISRRKSRQRQSGNAQK